MWSGHTLLSQPSRSFSPRPSDSTIWPLVCSWTSVWAVCLSANNVHHSFFHVQARLPFLQGPSPAHHLSKLLLFTAHTVLTSLHCLIFLTLITKCLYFLLSCFVFPWGLNLGLQHARKAPGHCVANTLSSPFYIACLLPSVHRTLCQYQRPHCPVCCYMTLAPV